MTPMNMAAWALTPVRRRNGYWQQHGSAGECVLQETFGTTQQAQEFYETQVTGRLTPLMQEFVQRMEMAFIATSDAAGECDCSFRAGPAGFIKVLDDRTIAYPEYRGNGVMASLGNILQNPHIGMFLVDFTRDLVGLHINGDASIITAARMQEYDLGITQNEDDTPGRKPVQWIVIRVTEAYIHCSRHIPKLVPQPRGDWEGREPGPRSGDYFGTAASKAAAGPAPLPARTA